jgi:hypothetical protein
MFCEPTLNEGILGYLQLIYGSGPHSNWRFIMTNTRIKKNFILVLVALLMLFGLMNGTIGGVEPVYAGECTMDSSTSC